MIRTMLTAAVASLIFTGAASAQTLTHTHGDSHDPHTHDITPVMVKGDCCCSSQIELIPVERHVKRTVTRTHVYTHPTVTRRIYTRIVPTTIIRSSHDSHHASHSHTHHHGAHHSHHKVKHVVVKEYEHTDNTKRERTETRVVVTHTDRADPYAHYDRRWKHHK
ncbi:MAG: hypothetical protein AAF768_12410 [Pseudomonadota bacterium]